MLMKKNLVALAAAAAALPAATSALAAEPTSGAYVTDVQNTWVQDRVGDRINTVNMIMCIMGAFRSDAMVNAGPYLALVDQKKCSGRSDSSQSNNTSAGQSNATKFMNAVVESTQASATAPLIMKAWITEEEDSHKMLISVYSVATAGKSDTYPNGLFSIHYCGTPADAPTGPCAMKGMLRSDANGLSFYEDESGGGGGGGGGGETKLVLQTNSTDTGSGQMTGTDGGSPYAYQFAYNSDYFRRSDGTVDACFSRDKAQADYSTWRYGTYKQDGSRLDSDHPGFPVKYVNGSNTYYGFWSFWGLWLPDSAMATVGASGTLTRRNGTSDETLTVVKRGGKLWKLTRQAATLDDFKNVPMMYWATNNIGSGASQLQQGSNYELQWDGTHLLATGKQVCSSDGCQPQPLSPQIELQAADFRTAGARVLPVFFPSGGGNGAINLTASGEFAGTNVLAYRVREMVAPGASDAPSSLVCLGMCPKSGTALTSAFASSPAAPFLTQSWSPVVSGSAKTYTYSDGMLSDGGGNVDGSSISGGLGQYQGGLTSGSLVSASDLSSLRCDPDGTPNTSGTHLCPSLVDTAAVSYQWETGPNQWNQYFGASGITIDPPKSLAFAVTGTNIRSANKARYVGNTLQLQFSGFGELQGIPGNCVDPDTNAPAACGQNVRYVPAFDIVDGATVVQGSNTYYVKYLERELRLGQLTGAAATTCKAAVSLPSTLTLPGASSLTVNPVTMLGAMPTLTTTKPAVIDGIVQ